MDQGWRNRDRWPRHALGLHRPGRLIAGQNPPAAHVAIPRPVAPGWWLWLPGIAGVGIKPAGPHCPVLVSCSGEGPAGGAGLEAIAQRHPNAQVASWFW